MVFGAFLGDQFFLRFLLKCVVWIVLCFGVIFVVVFLVLVMVVAGFSVICVLLSKTKNPRDPAGNRFFPKGLQKSDYSD